MFLEHFPTILGHQEIREHRRCIEVGQRQACAGQPRIVAHDLRHHTQASPGYGGGGPNLVLVCGLAAPGFGNPLGVDAPNEVRVSIVVGNADKLIAAGPLADVGRLQAWAFEGFVDITADRSRLVQREASMFKGRNTTEWLEISVVRWRAFFRKNIYGNVVVGDSLKWAPKMGPGVSPPDQVPKSHRTYGYSNIPSTPGMDGIFQYSNFPLS